MSNKATKLDKYVGSSLKSKIIISIMAAIVGRGIIK
jgi:hypothetical protein